MSPLVYNKKIMAPTPILYTRIVLVGTYRNLNYAIHIKLNQIKPIYLKKIKTRK